MNILKDEEIKDGISNALNIAIVFMFVSVSGCFIV